jgi:hypothetical protein
MGGNPAGHYAAVPGGEGLADLTFAAGFRPRKTPHVSSDLTNASCTGFAGMVTVWLIVVVNFCSTCYSVNANVSTTLPEATVMYCFPSNV